MNQFLKILKDPIGAAKEVKERGNLRGKIYKLSRDAAAGKPGAQEKLKKLLEQYNQPLKINQ